ncbi:MAG TPA: hypothetical protein ENJ54_04160 [Chloroflexi bacterium]|nr:hypothetical protein [Chloroflexota bacterium]
MDKKIVHTFGEWVPTEDGKGWLLDYVWEPRKKRALLAFRTPGKEAIGISHRVCVDDTCYYPVSDDGWVAQGAIVTPDGLGKAIPTHTLRAALAWFMQKYFTLATPLDYRLAADYALMTWVYDMFSVVSYLRVVGEREDALLLMRRIGQVCYRTIDTSLFSTQQVKQMMHTRPGTAFMGEVNISDKFDELLVILNVGAVKSAAKAWYFSEFVREDGTLGYKSKVCNVFGPKLVVTRGRFEDPQTEKRSFTLRLKPDEPAATPLSGERARQFYADAAHLRRLLLRWRLEHWQPEAKMSEDLAVYENNVRENWALFPFRMIAKRMDGGAPMLLDADAYLERERATYWEWKAERAEMEKKIAAMLRAEAE